MGTTGEGPSFSPDERLAIWRAALNVRKEHPNFRILAGTGTPSLEETIDLTKASFDLGFDAVVVLPPYYFREASPEGLFTWFSHLIQRGVPADGALLGYHIPQVSGIALSAVLLDHLHEAHPNQFIGIKDSSGDLAHAQHTAARYGDQFTLLVGNDKLLSASLEAGAAGCITALANLLSPDLRRIWDSHQTGQSDPGAQERLTAARAVMDAYPPAASLLKALLAHLHGFSRWPVRPPLLPTSEAAEQAAMQEFAKIQAQEA